MSNEKSRGFAAVEGLLIAVIIGLVIFVGWYVLSAQKKSNDTLDNSTNNSSVTKSKQGSGTTATENTADWKVFEDKTSKLAFKYPKDWILSENEETVGDGESRTVTSPDKKIVLEYANSIAGLGGGTCPDDFPCPVVEVTAKEKLPKAAKQNLSFVQIITERKDAGEKTPFILQFGVSNDSEMKVGTSVVQPKYITFTNNNRGGYFAYHYSSTSLDAFKTRAELNAFMQSDTYKTAKAIVTSVYDL